MNIKNISNKILIKLAHFPGIPPAATGGGAGSSAGDPCARPGQHDRDALAAPALPGLDPPSA